MAINNTRLSTAALTDVYTSVGVNAVTTIIACHTDPPDPTDEITNAAALTLHFCPSGIAASTTNMVVRDLLLPPGETVFFSDEKIILSNGDKIVAQASVGNKISITVSTLTV